MKTAALAVMLIAACGWFSAQWGLSGVLGVWLPYAAVLVCAVGLTFRLLRWARTPVPFAIPLVGGQIGGAYPGSSLNAPTSQAAVAGRLLLEALCFRSLLRNTYTDEIRHNPPAFPRLPVASSTWLWLFGLLMHASLLMVLLRHMRLWVDPVPAWITRLTLLDSPLGVGVPTLYLSGAVLLVALAVLTARRLPPRMRLLTLPADYFALFLLLGLTISGLCMRHALRIDLTRAKMHLLGLVRFTPGTTEGLDPIFLTHLTLACALLIVFPFSKLAHMVAVFFSPTRNLRCDTRAFRHINPWRQPSSNAAFRSYTQYEAAFAPRMREAGLPLEEEQTDANDGARC